ncbi:MAG: 30S ribosome-binding factor RbfA [Elusimicrobiota bacterium]
MKQTRRTQQVSGLIRKHLSSIIIEEIKDPNFGIVTITSVRVSTDLRVANVKFSIIGGKKRLDKQINIIKRMGKSLRGYLAKRIELKYIPALNMQYDKTPQKAQEIEKVIKKIEETE